MTEPRDFLFETIDPACAALTGITGREMGDDRARTMLLAIAFQESNLEYRRQVRGPARGLWQFEKAGGTAGVLAHERSKDAATAICKAMGVEPEPAVVYEALAADDNLAACFARLLLWTDPSPLPAIGDEEGAWQVYLRNWRPGKPHRARWAQAHAIAANTVMSGGNVPMADVMAGPVIQGQATVVAMAPGAPKPGTLTVSGASPVVVELPKMNRLWKTGEFWLQILSFVATGAVFLSPLLEPQMDKVADSPWLLSIPMGPAIFAAARQWYKAQRVKYATELAASSGSK